MRVVHLTTVHPRRDTRIFYRECVSLAEKGHQVFLVVADGKSDEELFGVKILDLGKESNRIKNFFNNHKKILEKIRLIKPDLMHFHDPELIFVANKIKRIGTPVVFDIHENISLQILNKTYLPKLLRPLISSLYRIMESRLIKDFHLVLAEYSYERSYEGKGVTLTTVLNMPKKRDFDSFYCNKRKGNGIFYIGGISNNRGLDVTLKALTILKERGVDFFMHYIGPIGQKELDRSHFDSISDKIRFYGRMDSKEAFKISKNCIVGLSVLRPIGNYKESYSTKIFEYMAVGMPVITSKFPLYQNVVEKYECGYCIDPYSAEQLANSIELLMYDSILVNEMGENGRDAVVELFNWSAEEGKLFKLYDGIKKAY